MFRETMGAAIDGARTLAQMDELSRQVWQAHASGAVDDAGAQSLAERLHERRSTIPSRDRARGHSCGPCEPLPTAPVPGITRPERITGPAPSAGLIRPDAAHS